MTNKQKEKSKKTKLRLMQCAEKLFIKKGFNKTTIVDIVTEAKVAKGTFYLYYEAKEEVLFEIVDKFLEENKKQLDTLSFESLNIDEIETIIDNYVYLMESNSDIITLFHDISMLEMIHSRNIFQKLEQSLVKPIEQWISSGIEQGVFKKINVKLYSVIIFHLAHELLEKAFLYNYPADIITVKRELVNIIKSILLL